MIQGIRLVGLFILGLLIIGHKNSPTCSTQSTSEVHAVCSADAFNFQESSSGHVHFHMLVVLASENKIRIPKKYHIFYETLKE